MNTKVIRKNLIRKKRIVVLRRFVNILLLLITLLTLVIIIRNWMRNSVDYTYDGEYTTYYVSSGDRLWTIAEQYSNDKDIRDVISAIKKDNNMSNSNIYVGQELLIRNQY